MNCKHPTPSDIPQLKQLWQLCFPDEPESIARFFRLGFRTDHALCLHHDQITAALYWLDCKLDGRSMAYLYAVGTDPAHRMQGLCRRLLSETAEHLRQSGYAGALLVPENPSLAAMYGAMGFTPATGIREFSCPPGTPCTMERLTARQYLDERQHLLPESGVEQGLDAVMLTGAAFYRGEGFLAAVTAQDGKAVCHELLGRADAAPGIVAALGMQSGFFRTPGGDAPFAMLQKLTPDCPEPGYLGLALDL